MPDQIKKYTDPVKARWDLLTTPQRYKLLGVIAGVLILIALILFLALRTPWEVLTTREDRMTIAPMQNALNDAGIRNEIIDNGRGLRVDRRRVNEALAIIEIEGVAPHDEHFTWEDALNTGLGTTDGERRLRYVRAMEGSIESQLRNMNGIVGARVGLDIPDRRPFERDGPVPNAAVTIHVTQDFNHQQGRNLAHLVARRVSELTPDNIVIMDQNARMVWNGIDDVNDDPLGSAIALREHHRSLAILGVQQIMAPVFPEVSVAFIPVFSEEISREEIRRELRIPEGMEDGGIVLYYSGERTEVEGGAGGLEPGLQNNMATFPNYAMPGGGDVEMRQRIWDRHFGVDEITTAIITGPGGLDPGASVASVMVVKDQPVYQSHWMAQTPDGEEPRTQQDWEIFKAENTVPRLVNYEFAETAHFHALAARAIGLPIENVEFVVMQRIVPNDIVVRTWDIPTILMVAVLLLLLAMLLYGLLRRQRTAGEDEETLEPQLAVEDLLVSTQLDEAKEEAAQELEEIDYFKENEIKKHIEKFVNERPEAVAALLRNWINVEEW